MFKKIDDKWKVIHLMNPHYLLKLLKDDCQNESANNQYSISS
jgi:hypothetical protein